MSFADFFVFFGENRDTDVPGRDRFGETLGTWGGIRVQHAEGRLGGGWMVRTLFRPSHLTRAHETRVPQRAMCLPVRRRFSFEI